MEMKTKSYNFLEQKRHEFRANMKGEI